MSSYVLLGAFRVERKGGDLVVADKCFSMMSDCGLNQTKTKGQFQQSISVSKNKNAQFYTAKKYMERMGQFISYRKRKREILFIHKKKRSFFHFLF